MYRTLGTRGSVFGVASGPYAGKERWVAFRRLSPAARTRLVDALGGRGQLAPLLRSSKTGRSLALPAALAVLASLYLLFIHGWPAAQRAPLALGYISGGLALALLAHRRTRALSHQGTTITAGAYLFPLDIIEARPDGSLHLIPLGGIREAGVVRQDGGHALVLTFSDGMTRTFPVTSERAAEAAYAALESAQSTLEKLTYGNDLADAVNLDPFFEVRIDDSWESVSAPAGNTAPGRTLLRFPSFPTFSTFAIAIALGVGLFLARNVVAHRVRDTERARRAAEIARLQEKLAEDERQHAQDDAEAARARQEVAAHPRDVRDAGVGLAAYKTLAPSGEMVAIVTELVARAAKTGAGLPVYFAHTMKTCVASATCTPVSEGSLPAMERRVVDAFEAVLSETIPRESLPVAIVSTRPGTPSLVVEYSVSQVGDEPQAIQMVFDVKLAAPGHAEPRTFRLTMPPPSTPLTHPRDRSVFSLGEHAANDELVYARGFDRLYDEIYGLFFSGPSRVPLPTESQELRRAFGVP